MQLALFCLTVVVAPVAGLNPLEMKDVLDGKVPTRIESFASPSGKSAGRGLGAIVIERPLGEVWSTLMRYEERPEYAPRVKSVTILERQASRTRIRQEIDAAVTTARYTAFYDSDDSAHTIHWTLDKSAAGNTVVDVDGEYRAVEIAPQRTLLVYRTYVDTGMKIPRSIQTWFQVRAIPDLLRAFKKRIESGGTWRKR